MARRKNHSLMRANFLLHLPDSTVDSMSSNETPLYLVLLMILNFAALFRLRAVRYQTGAPLANLTDYLPGIRPLVADVKLWRQIGY